jgi:GTP-binding protein
MSKARFIKTAILPKDYPVIRNVKGQILPEIAVAGRSNVGKSSLLNHLFHTKHLVKTSSMPGKTQALNFFAFEERWAFADLPGYGYAQVPQAVRKQWGPMVQAYLDKREPLQLVLFLMDIRRIPNQDDLQFLDWIVHSQKGMILVLTKVDKVNRNERKLNTAKILDALGASNIHYVYYSTTKNQGRRELLAMIADALAGEKEQEETPLEEQEETPLEE